ncbi:HpcH/HpaI aldolase/citrate lyase family protein [Nakamurella sp. GG22]
MVPASPAGANPPTAEPTEHPPQTFLFVPGDRPERFDKAVTAGPDAVIIDLEDSVPHANKATARSAVTAWLRTGRAYLRVNPAGTTDFTADLQMVASVLAGANGLTGIVLPKAEKLQDIDNLAAHMTPDLKIVALIESAKGLLGAADIATHPAVELLAFGNLDFAADCGLTIQGPQELELLPARAHLSYTSRAAGLPGPIDGVTPDVNDDAAIEHDAGRAARLGFTGKLCIHPRQIAAVHRAFAPRADQVMWAQRILDSISEGVGLIDGAMVDRPVILQAQHIIERSQRRAG